jgi:hypothetical protein
MAGRNGGKRAGAGRKPGDGLFVPTDEQRRLVTIASGVIGAPEDKIRLLVINPETNEPIAPMTLRKHFRGELDEGLRAADAQVAMGLFKNATTGTDTYPGGNPISQIFWLKCRMRWQQDPSKVIEPPPLLPDGKEDMMDVTRRLAFMLAKADAET